MAQVPAPDEELFREIVESIEAITYVVRADDPEAPPIYVSPQCERILGITREHIQTSVSSQYEMIHPEDREWMFERFAASAETGSFDEEHRIVTPDGDVRWVRTTSRLLPPTADGPSLWFSVMTDVSSRRRAEDDLLRSEARYRALVERLPVIVYVDSDEIAPQSLYVSPNAQEILGYPPALYLEDSGLWPRSIHPDDVGRVMSAWAQAVERTEPFHQEYRSLRPDGRVVWVRDAAILVCGDEGERLFWQGVLEDITTERSATEEARATDARYSALVEGIPAIVYEMGTDDERRTIYVSRHVEEVFGYSREEWLDQTDIWTELLHPDDREIELAANDLHNETGEPWSREYRLIAADGRNVWVRDQATLVRDDDGNPLFWQGVMLDISGQKGLEEDLRRANDELEFRVLARTTELAEANEMMSLEIGERRRAEAQLRDAEERYRLLVERLPAVVYVWEVERPDRPTGRATRAYTSPHIEALLGYTSAEWLQERLYIERIHPHDVGAVDAGARHSEITGEPFLLEYRYLAKDGRVVWVLDQATLLSRDRHGRPDLFQGVMLDITARKAAEDQAAEAETKFRMLAEQGPVIAYLWEHSERPDEPGAFSYVSPRIESVLGYPLESWVNDANFWTSAVHPDDRERVAAADEEIERTGEPWSLDYRLIAADGRVVWLHDEGDLVSRDEQGHPKTFQGVFLDVTARKEAEATLREAEERYRLVVEGMPAIPYTEVVDAQTNTARMVFIGPQCEAVFGYTSQELLDEPDHFGRMVLPEDRERLLASAEHANETGEPWDEEYRVMARDGRIVWLHSRAVLVSEDQERRIWQGVAMDVTARKAGEGSPLRDPEAASER